MENEYLHSFERLKRQLVETCRASFPFLPEDLQAWKGTEIACFQEVLEEKTKGRISEKSFYNYFKTGKMPREDVLDLFAQMVGEINWKDFVRKDSLAHHSLQLRPGNDEQGNGVEGNDNETNNPQNSVDIVVVNDKTTTLFSPKWKIALATLFFLGTSGLIFYAAKEKESPNVRTKICFEDAYTHRPIVEPVEIHLIDDERQNVFKTDSLGCLEWENEAAYLSFYVKSPYYKADTFKIEGKRSQNILLKPDDYAMMIRLYASGKIADWEAHLGRLQAMFAADAEIFQIDTETGYIMEVWNKEEFIEKLTTPIPSLQQLEVLETQYDNKGKIKVLRFWQK